MHRSLPGHVPPFWLSCGKQRVFLVQSWDAATKATDIILFPSETFINIVEQSTAVNNGYSRKDCRNWSWGKLRGFRFEETCANNNNTILMKIVGQKILFQYCKGRRTKCCTSRGPRTRNLKAVLFVSLNRICWNYQLKLGTSGSG